MYRLSNLRTLSVPHLRADLPKSAVTPVRLSSLIIGNWEQNGHTGMKVIDFHLLRHERGVRRAGRCRYCWEASGCLCLMMEPFVGDSHISCL